MKFLFLTLFASLTSFSLFAQVEIHDTKGVNFPHTVSFEENGKRYNLQETGQAIRKKFFVKVYAIASYLQQDTDQQSFGDKFEQIVQSDKAKQLTMKWLHDVSVEKIQNGYRESFKNSLTPAQQNQLQNEIEKFVHFFNQHAQKGDEHILRTLPGGTVEVIVNGNKVGSLTNPEFARGLWNIWFGTKSIVDRNQLVSLMQ